jgi:hypothetical protein
MMFRLIHMMFWCINHDSPNTRAWWSDLFSMAFSLLDQRGLFGTWCSGSETMLFWYIQHTVAIVRTGRVIRNMMFHTAEQRGVPVERVDHILRMLRHTGTSHTLHYLHRRPLSRMQSLQVPCEAYCTPASALSLQIQHSLLALALHTRQTSTERATKHICRTPQIKMLDTRKRYSQTVKAKLCFNFF